VGRIIARKLQEGLGQVLVVDNRGGAGGTLGTDLAAKAPPDGHTLLINNISLAVNATLFSKLPYDTLKDLAPVSLVAEQPNILVVHAGVKAKSVKDLIALARAQPDGLIYGSGGPGSSSHLATERLRLATGIKLTHVPYKGLGQAMTDLIGGRVELIVATASTALPMVKAGKVVALAVTTARRYALLPQVPTVSESGVPDFVVTTWYAVLVPGATPRTIVARLNQELAKVAADDAVRQQFAAQGLHPEHTSPEQALAHIKAEIEHWGKVVRAAGLKPN
jgi:tripartite-type tricarboxylate transporter receptor subunit TctC